jgi:hypothetical protein
VDGGSSQVYQKDLNNMKVCLNQLLYQQRVGKKIAKQKNIHENFWGATILDVYASRDPYCEDHAIYIIKTDISGNNLIIINPDDEIDLE